MRSPLICFILIFLIFVYHSSALCGNGVFEVSEQCDDGNTDNGDGCSSTCTQEPGSLCPLLPTVTSPAPDFLFPGNSMSSVHAPSSCSGGFIDGDTIFYDPINPNPTICTGFPDFNDVGFFVSAWVKPVDDLDPDTFYTVFSKWIKPTSPHLRFGILGNSLHLQMGVRPSGQIRPVIGSPIYFPPNKWTHIAVGYDWQASYGYMYVNGLQKFITTDSSSSPKSGDQLIAHAETVTRIGHVLDASTNLPGDFFYGNISMITVYQKFIGPEEVYGLYLEQLLRFNGNYTRKCQGTCGNGILETSEACDDANNVPGDGCYNCQVEDSYSCPKYQPVTYSKPPIFSYKGDVFNPQYPSGNCQTFGEVLINGEEVFLNGRGHLECDPFLIDGNITVTLWIKGPPGHGDAREIYTWEEFRQTVVQVWSGNPNTSFIFTHYAGSPMFTMNLTDSDTGELDTEYSVSNFDWQSDPDSIWTFVAVTIDDANKQYLYFDDIYYSTSHSTYSSTQTALEQTPTNYRIIIGAKNNGTDLIQPYLGSVAGITVWDYALDYSELRNIYVSQLYKFKAPRNGLACASSCGNGLLEEGEQCDDNNNIDGDGCSSTCISDTGKSCSISPLSTYQVSADWEFPNSMCSQVGNSLLQKGDEFLFPFITNTYFNCTSNFNPTTQLTVAAWVKLSQKVSDYRRDWIPIVSRWGSNYDEIEYNQFTFTLYDGDIYDLEVNDTYIASTYYRVNPRYLETWLLYAATYTEGEEMAIYVNGQRLYIANPDDVIGPLPTRPILVGAHVPSSGIIDPAQIFSGSLAKIWMWERTLNQSEIFDLFTSTVQKYWTADNVCQIKCGNGIMEDGETCDDGNFINGDGCSSTCHSEVGFTCTQLQIGNWQVPVIVFPYDPNYPLFNISSCIGEPAIGLFPSQVVEFSTWTDQHYVCNFEFNLTTEFTFSAWIKIDPSSVNGTIFSRWRDYGVDSYYFGYDNAKIIKIALDRGKPYLSVDDLTLKANTTVKLNKWNSLIISLKTNGGDLRMVLNGESVISPTKYFKPSLVLLETEYIPYLIGSHYEDYPDMNATAFFKGSLSDLKIWNYAMNESEIRQLYNISSTKYGECADIDECATNNGGCQVTCVNTIGSFYCVCPPGYEVLANAFNCTDINECLDNNGGCLDVCFNTLGGYVCSCADVNAQLNYDGKTCSCKAGFEINGTNCTDIDECKLGTHICNYTCINTKGGYTCGCPSGYQTVNLFYCEDVDECLYKEGSPDCDNCTNTVGSFYCSCDPGNVLFEEICQNALAIENRGKLTVGGIAGIVVGSVIGIIILILIILAILFGRRYLLGNYLSLLPPDVRAPYEHFFSNTSEWTKKGEPAFYCRSIDKGSKEWSSVEAFLAEMDGGELVPSEIHAIFNPTLTSNFANQRSLMASRFSTNPNLFLAKGWERNDPEGLRGWVYEKYRALTKKFAWNEGQAAPIVACVHGTGGDIAWKICETGFVALSSLDAGYYGKGIYFTSSCMYAVPYYATRPNPTILISYLTAGNIYPVTEHYKSQNSLMGSALVPGYNSHYVLTKKDGSVCTEQKDKYYDEIVIDQESQVCPLYLIHLEPSNMSKLAKKFQRDVPEPPEITRDVQRNMDIEMRIL